MIASIKNPIIRKLILEKMFGEGKFMSLIKYNKKLQKIFDITLTDYKNFIQIIVDLFIIEPSKLKRSQNYFINFTKDRANYIIYFNDSNKKIEKNYFTPEDKVNKITVKLNYHVDNLSELFYIKNYGGFTCCDCIKTIDFILFNNKNIEDMSFMFYGCSALNNIYLFKVHTEKVKNMSYMFYGCSSLDNLDLSNFNTEKVTNMFCMFSKCSSLTKIDLKQFNTKNVVNMGNMFESCGKLEQLKNFNFTTNNTTNMSSMFEGCSSLSYINTSNFVTDKVYTFDYMFKGCVKLSLLDISGFRFNYNAEMREMFSGCDIILKEEMKKQNSHLKKEALLDDIEKYPPFRNIFFH